MFVYKRKMRWCDLELRQYVETYLDLIHDVLEKSQPDYDDNCLRSQLLMEQEEQMAEQEYYNYRSDHGKPPDRVFLMEQVIFFGVNRADFFNGNHREITKEDFIKAHLDMVKDGNVLVSSQFEHADYGFILKRETHLAEQAFERNSQQLAGYEALNVVDSKKKQEWLLQQLKQRFEQECESFYLGMRKG